MDAYLGGLGVRHSADPFLDLLRPLAGLIISSLSRLWALLGPLGALLGPLGALLGPLGALLEPSWGHLGRLKTQSGEVAKAYENHLFLNGLGAPRGSKTGPSWAKLGLSCDLEPSQRPREASEDVLLSSYRRLVVFISS